MNIIEIKERNKRWDKLPENLRLALTSQYSDLALDDIARQNSLTEEQRFDLEDIVDYIFYGFISAKDLFDEVKSSLKLDSRTALDVYNQVNEKLILSLRKDVETNFEQYRADVARESETPQSKPISQQVVLKEGPEVINLKTEITEIPLFKKLVVESIPKAITITPEIQKTLTQPTAVGSVPEGPFMLHKKEESQSVSQMQTQKGFGSASLGGFWGASMKSFGVQKSQDSVSVAKIEMPFEQKKSLNEYEIQKVPVVIKKYEQEPAKTIHYSSFKSPLEKGIDGSVKTIVSSVSQQYQPPKKPEAKDEGMIDLNNLTLNK